MAFVLSLLVLLIIATAPPTEHVLLFDIPEPKFVEYFAPGYPAPQTGQTIDTRGEVGINRITIAEGGTLFWNGAAVSKAQLQSRLRATLHEPLEPELLFEPDPQAGFGSSARTLRMIKASGVTKFNFVSLRTHCQFGHTAANRRVTIRGPQVLLSLTLVANDFWASGRPQPPEYETVCPSPS